MAAVSKHGGPRKDPMTGLRIVPTPWLPWTALKYAVDVSVNLSTKGNKGFQQLHKTVQEDLKDGASLKVCNEEKQKQETTNNVEKMQEEMNAMKLKSKMSSETLELSSSKEFPTEQVEKKNLLMPNRKRVMIRSRL